MLALKSTRLNLANAWSLDWAKVRETDTQFLLIPGADLRDPITGRQLKTPGGLSVGPNGQVLTFNGSQQGNLPLSLPRGGTGLVVAGRIMATATQSSTPGSAFGFHSLTSQRGVGIGFDPSNNVGATQLTTGGAYLPSNSPGVQNRWYTVYAEARTDTSGHTRAYIDGVIAATGDQLTIGVSDFDPDEIAVGAQHRSAGFLRQFRGQIEWGALFYVKDALLGVNGLGLTPEIAANMYASGYPYNLFR